ncbi:hypothetical protein [Holospora elegans]|nr:hypothetical protein [Holospora elegans]
MNIPPVRTTPKIHVASMNFSAPMHSDDFNESIIPVNSNNIPMLFGVSSAPVSRNVLDDFEKNLNLVKKWIKFFDGFMHIDFIGQLRAGGKDFCFSLANHFSSLRMCLENGEFKLKQIVFLDGKKTFVDCSDKFFNAIIKALDKLDNPEQMKILEDVMHNDFEIFLKFLDLKNISIHSLSYKLSVNLARQFRNLRMCSENEVFVLKRNFISDEKETSIECSNRIFSLIVKALDCLDLPEQIDILEKAFVEDFRLFEKYVDLKEGINNLPEELIKKIAETLIYLRKSSEKINFVQNQCYIKENHELANEKLIDFNEQFSFGVKALQCLDTSKQIKILDDLFFKNFEIFQKYLDSKGGINNVSKELINSLASKIVDLNAYLERQVLKLRWMNDEKRNFINCTKERFDLVFEALKCVDDSKRIEILEKAACNNFEVFFNFLDSENVNFSSFSDKTASKFIEAFGNLKVVLENTKPVLKHKVVFNKMETFINCSEKRFEIIVKALNEIQNFQVMQAFRDAFFINFEVFQKYVNLNGGINTLSKELIIELAKEFSSFRMCLENKGLKNREFKLQLKGGGEKKEQLVDHPEKNFNFIVEALKCIDDSKRMEILEETARNDFEVFLNFPGLENISVDNFSYELKSKFVKEFGKLKMGLENRKSVLKRSIYIGDKRSQSIDCSEKIWALILRVLTQMDKLKEPEIKIFKDVAFSDFEIFEKYLDSKGGMIKLPEELIAAIAEEFSSFRMCLENKAIKLKRNIVREKHSNCVDCPEKIRNIVFEALNTLGRLKKRFKSTQIRIFENALDKNFEVLLEYLLENDSEYLCNNGINDFSKKLGDKIAKELRNLRICLENEAFVLKREIIINEKKIRVDCSEKLFGYIVEALKFLDKSTQIKILEELACNDFEFFLKFSGLESGIDYFFKNSKIQFLNLGFGANDFSKDLKKKLANELSNLRMCLEGDSLVLKRRIFIDGQEILVDCSEKKMFSSIGEASRVLNKLDQGGYHHQYIKILEEVAQNDFEVFLKFLDLERVRIGGFSKDLKIKLANELRNLEIYLENTALVLKRQRIIDGQKILIDCSEGVFNRIADAVEFLTKSDRAMILEEVAGNNFEVFFKFSNLEIISVDNFSYELKIRLANELSNLRLCLENEGIMLKRQGLIRGQKTLIDSSEEVFSRGVKAIESLGKADQTKIFEKVADNDVELFFKLLNLKKNLKISVDNFSYELKIKLANELSNLRVCLESEGLVLKRQGVISGRKTLIDCSEHMFSLIVSALDQIENSQATKIIKSNFFENFEVFRKYVDFKGGGDTFNKILIAELAKEVNILRMCAQASSIVLKHRSFINGQEILRDCSEEMQDIIFEALHTLGKLDTESQSEQIRILRKLFSENFEIFQKYFTLQNVYSEGLVEKFKDLLANKFLELVIFEDSMENLYFYRDNSKEKFSCTEEMLAFILEGIKKFSENEQIELCEKFLLINEGSSENRYLFLDFFFKKEMEFIRKKIKNEEFLNQFKNSIDIHKYDEFLKIFHTSEENLNAKGKNDWIQYVEENFLEENTLDSFLNFLKGKDPEDFPKIVKNLKKHKIKEIQKLFLKDSSENNKNEKAEGAKNNNQSYKKNQFNTDFNRNGERGDLNKTAKKNFKNQNSSQKKILEENFLRSAGCCSSEVRIEAVRDAIQENPEGSLDKTLLKFKVIKSANLKEIEKLEVFQSCCNKINKFFIFSKKTLRNNDKVFDGFSEYLIRRYGNISKDIKESQEFVLKNPENVYQTLLEAANRDVEIKKFKNFFRDTINNFIRKNFQSVPSIFELFLKNFFKKKEINEENIDQCIKSCLNFIEDDHSICKKYLMNESQCCEFKKVLNQKFQEFKENYQYDFNQKNEKSDFYAYFELEKLFKNTFEKYCKNSLLSNSLSFAKLREDAVLTLIKINAYDE